MSDVPKIVEGLVGEKYAKPYQSSAVFRASVVTLANLLPYVMEAIFNQALTQEQMHALSKKTYFGELP